MKYEIVPLPVLLEQLNRFKPFSRASFFRRAKELGIKHAGYRVRPRLYRVSDGEKILHHLGFLDAKIVVSTEPGRLVNPPAKAALLTLPQLKAQRKGGRK